MKRAARVLGVFGLLVFCFVLWYTIASDYGDGVTSGTYYLAQNGESSTLTLKVDHGFQQELRRAGKTEYATGTWRRVGEGGIEFSHEFLVVSGQELGADGTPHGEIHKNLGFLVSLTLSTYDVEWYLRVGSSPDNTVAGIYNGDEEGVPATLIVRADHTFDQTVSHVGDSKHANGTWNVNQSGDIAFSKAFLKTTGEALGEDETASAGDPKGGPLQIRVERTPKTGTLAFRKKQLPW
jgi:hypothetical protein